MVAEVTLSKKLPFRKYHLLDVFSIFVVYRYLSQAVLILEDRRALNACGELL
jgi:hypothetical protein